MIPVYQDRHGSADASGNSVKGGNCAWACVASILELPFDYVRHLPPPADADLLEWTEDYRPDLQFHNVSLRYDYETVPGPGRPSWEGPHAWERWTYKIRESYTPPETEFGVWMATIYSPGIRARADDPFYPSPGLHAVVFEGRELVHDPNAKYPCPRLTPKVLGMSWWTYV